MILVLLLLDGSEYFYWKIRMMKCLLIIKGKEIVERKKNIVVVSRKTLDDIQLKNCPDLSLFFDDFEKQRSETLNYMLRALPSNYSHMVDLIDVLQDKDTTVNLSENEN